MLKVYQVTYTIVWKNGEPGSETKHSRTKSKPTQQSNSWWCFCWPTRTRVNHIFCPPMSLWCEELDFLTTEKLLLWSPKPRHLHSCSDRKKWSTVQSFWGFTESRSDRWVLIMDLLPHAKKSGIWTCWWNSWCGYSHKCRKADIIGNMH